MPYIIMKRSDIPDPGVQVLDLLPNTSQRNVPYKPVSQSKYCRAHQNDALNATAGGVVLTTSYGLASWFHGNVNDGTGAASSGTATVAAVAALDTFTITTAPAFLITAVNAPRTPGASDFEDSASAGSDIAAAASLAAAINDDANWAATGITRPVSAANGGTAVVTITALADGVAGDYVLASSDGGRLAVVGMAGGADAAANTVVDSTANAVDVETLLAYGDVTAAAGALTVAAINGALTAGSITAAQLSDVLDILAGREFCLAAGTVVEAAVVFQGPVGAFTAGTLRNVYLTDSLRLSFGEGRLSLLTRDDFNYAGVASNATNTNLEAVAVYSDDGSLFPATLP